MLSKQEEFLALLKNSLNSDNSEGTQDKGNDYFEDKKYKDVRMSDEFWTMVRNLEIPARYANKRLANIKARDKKQQAFLDALLHMFENKPASGIVFGASGTGKTALATCYCADVLCKNILANWERKRGDYSVSYVSAIKLLSLCQDRAQRAEWLYNQNASSLLIIDDIGVFPMSPNFYALLFELINQRYNAKLKTLVLSILPPADIANYLTTPIVRRLIEDELLISLFDEEE